MPLVEKRRMYLKTIVFGHKDMVRGDAAYSRLVIGSLWLDERSKQRTMFSNQIINS